MSILFFAQMTGFQKVLNQHNVPATFSCRDRADMTSGCKPGETTETEVLSSREGPFVILHIEVCRSGKMRL